MQGCTVRRVAVPGKQTTALFLSFFFLAALRSMWNLSSLTRDPTHAACIGSMES